MYGLTIKIWNSEYNEKQDIFKIDDILVLLWTEICSTDLPHFSTIVKNLVGNESIDSLVNERLSLIKSELIEDDEPIGEVDEIGGDDDKEYKPHTDNENLTQNMMIEIKESKANEEDKSLIKKEDSQVSKIQYECKICGKIYAKAKFLRKHEALHKTNPESFKKTQQTMEFRKKSNHVRY